MKQNERAIYHIIIGLCALFMAIAFCMVDYTKRKCKEEIETYSSYDDDIKEIGSNIETYVLDVIYETDLFELIKPEEQEYLDSLEEEWKAGYYIELLTLYGKYCK